MKKLYFGLAALLSFLAVSPALGATGVLNNEVTTDYYYPGTWNNLALDFTLQHQSGATGEADTLNTLTVKNNGAARNGFEITAVKLWADGGLPGWQGWGVDQEVATGSFFNDSWYFNGLRLAIPAGGQRLFITVDIKNYIEARKTVQLYLPALNDDNSNSVYDLGETGIFMTSGVNGPALPVFNTETSAVSTTITDLWAPQAIITNLTEQQSLTVAAGGNYLITGEARDQGRGHTASVSLGIGASEASLVWGEAVNTGVDFSTWSYDWQKIEAGSYIIKIKSSDDSHNLSAESSGLTVKMPAVEAPIVAVTLADGVLAQTTVGGSIYLIKGGQKCLIASDAIFNSWGYDQAKVVTVDLNAYADGEPVKFRDGYLIKGADAKVFVVSEGGKRWIGDGAVFEGLGYRWNKINLVTEAQLATYPAGADITKAYIHPAGTLIKYATYPEVFLLTADGKRRHIANETTYLGLGYHWDNIITVPDWEYYPDGAEITL
ncbi:MAG: hypothetical protein WCT37_03705 [Patescibacteria group bacterium]|jgi:hypothetical protein